MAQGSAVLQFRPRPGAALEQYDLEDPQAVRELVVRELARIKRTPRWHAVAAEVGVKPNALYCLVSGKTFLPRTANMFRLFRALGFTLTASRW